MTTTTTLANMIIDVMDDGDTVTDILHKIAKEYPEYIVRKIDQRGDDGIKQARSEISARIVESEGIYFTCNRSTTPHQYSLFRRGGKPYTTKTIVLDDRHYTVAEAEDYMGHLLYDDGVPFDDRFYVSFFVTYNKSSNPINSSAQYMHYDDDDNIDIDVTFLTDLDSTMDYLNGVKMDYGEQEGDTVMHQKRLFVGDFIQDIMIEQSEIYDDVQVLGVALRTLHSDDARRQVRSIIQSVYSE